MENAKLKSSKVYAWVLVIALGLMSAGTTGSYSVIAGSFVAPVCEEFGFDLSENSSPRLLARFGSPSSSLFCSPPAQAWPSTPKSGCSSPLAP